MSPITSSSLYLTTVGNHESDWKGTATTYVGTDSGGECGVMATRLYPQPYPATTDAPWWSYDIGLIHLIGISSEHSYAAGSPQYIWLENDLKSVNRSITPWIIFGSHRAMYLNSGYSTDISDSASLLTLEPLLYTYRVNLGFYGHNRKLTDYS